MTKYTKELHNRLRQLDKDASPAPWTVDFDNSVLGGYKILDDGNKLYEDLGVCPICSYSTSESNINANLIVEVRNALPLLLDRIEELEKKNIDSTGGESVR